MDSDGDGGPPDVPYNLPDTLGPEVTIDEPEEQCLADACLLVDSPCFAHGDLGQELDCPVCGPDERCGAGGVASECATPICSADGWCWEAPFPQGNSIFALWGAENGEYWAVGHKGTILHWDNTAWRKIESGTEEPLLTVFGFGPDDVWIAGYKDTIFHWNGEDLVSEGTGGYIDYSDVWGASPSEIWFVSSGQSLRFRDGNGFSDVPLPEHASITAIWGSSADEVWAVGGRSTILHWNGEEWTPVEHTLTGGFSDVWASGPNDIWIAGLGLHHFDGVEWATVPFTEKWNMKGVHGTAADDLWAVTLRGKVLHYDGQEWSCAPSGSVWRPQAIFSHAPGKVWVGVDSGQLVRFDDWKFSAIANERSYWHGVWAGAADDVWLAGNYGTVSHWDGQQWTRNRIDHSEYPHVTFTDVFGFSSDDVWVVGDGPAYHFDGAQWQRKSDASNLYRLWGSSPNDLWAVSGSRIVRWDGSEWQTWTFAADAQISGIWGSGRDDVWAAGWKKVLHWDGSEWTITEVQYEIYSVFGTGPDDVWFVDADLVHWDGFQFQRHFRPSMPSGVRFRGIWADETHGVWAVGHGSISDSGGEIIHFENDEWVRKQSGTQIWTNDVYGLPGGPSWAVGDRGLVLRYDPN